MSGKIKQLQESGRQHRLRIEALEIAVEELLTERDEWRADAERLREHANRLYALVGSLPLIVRTSVDSDHRTLLHAHDALVAKYGGKT